MTQIPSPGSIDVEAIRAEAERIRKAAAQRQEQGSDFMKFTAGVNYGRILPPPAGKKTWVKKVFRHRDLPFPDGLSSRLCYENMFPTLGIKCPWCVVCPQLAEVTDKVHKWVNEQEYVNWFAYDIDPTTQMLKPKRIRPYLVGLAPTIYNWIVMQMANPQIGLDAFVGIQNGCVMTVNRPVKFEGKENYSMSLIPNRGPLVADPTQQAEIIKQIHDLDRIFAPPTQEDLNKMAQEAQQLLQQFGRMLNAAAGLNLPGVTPPAAVPAGPPVAPPPASPVAPVQPVPPPPAVEQKFWVSLASGVTEMVSSQIVAALANKSVLPTTPCMSHDQSSGWKTIQDLVK